MFGEECRDEYRDGDAGGEDEVSRGAGEKEETKFEGEYRSGGLLILKLFLLIKAKVKKSLWTRDKGKQEENLPLLP